MIELNRDNILRAKTPPVKVEIPALDGYVYVRRFNAREILQLATIISKDEKASLEPVVRIKLRTIVDAKGRSLFNTDEEIDAFLDGVDDTTTKAVMDAIDSINVSLEDQLEEAEKN